MYRFSLAFLVLIIFSNFALAKPQIKLIHKRGQDNKAMIQIKNESNYLLDCYVAIDGHKKHFKLKPNRLSKSFKATHSKFNSNHFSVSCDYA
jgi:hypothetical protein